MVGIKYYTIHINCLLTTNAQNFSRILEAEKRSKFRVEKGPFQFVTHCYIGHSPVNSHQGILTYFIFKIRTLIFKIQASDF